MPGRGCTGPERELPSRGDNVIRLTDINEPTIAVFKGPVRSRMLGQLLQMEVVRVC